MAHHQTSRALLILFTFQLSIVSLYANPQTFGPLIRDRAIRDRQQTSEESLNANIELIFQKDMKTTSPPKEHNTDEVEPSPTELVSRSHGGGTLRPRRPLDNNEQNAVLQVYRDAEGKLVPMFNYPQTLATTPKPDAQSVTEIGGSLVLKIASESNQSLQPEVDNPIFEKGSYPEGYPSEMIDRILATNKGRYEEFFENKFKRDPLATRTNSESDIFLCASTAHTEYPTYNREVNRYIVNQKGFYQPVVFETCIENNSTCTKSSTGAKYELKCMQTYRTYKMFAAPLNDTNSGKLELIDVRFPACCKCAQINRPIKPSN